MQIRIAQEADLPAMLALAEAKRQEYAAYSPVFWHVAEDAQERQRSFFLNQRLHNPEVLTLVAEADGHIHGFVIAEIRQAPPVYNPGGPVCLIDDYTVANAEQWHDIGSKLLDTATSWAKQRGAVLLVVVTAQRDLAKRDMLREEGANVVSEWWVKEII